MTSMVSLVLELPPPPLPPSLRHPAVRTATAPRVALAVSFDLMRMCTPSDTCLVEGWPGGRRGRLPGSRVGTASAAAGSGTGHARGTAADAPGHRRGDLAGDPVAVRGREDVG